MGWAGGYLDAQFTGSSIGVRQRNAIDLYYSIDRGPLQWRRNVSGNVTLATGLSGTTHTVRIGYRERAGSYTGDPVFGGLILAGGGQTARITRPQNFVEFIGDSITVGQPTQFQQNYIVMLQRVRQAYPNAHIFAMATFRGRYVPETRNAVTAVGDSRVHFVDTTGWIGTADLVDSVHPNDAGHAKIAQRLTPVIDQYV